ncbi:MAG: hypothetical protein M3416_01455 [Acidobacteriota bacterium]|nr:hypothetical protein [Acidobacteriota bacterium]
MLNRVFATLLLAAALAACAATTNPTDGREPPGELTPPERAKDYLFRGIVASLARFVVEQPAAA